MADPQEFNSLDELFRKTFEDLPDTPASSGWDTPSPQVWDQVRVRLKPPHSGWSTQTIILVSGLAIALMLGLYWALTRPEQPGQTVAQQEQATALTAPAETRAESTAPLPEPEQMRPAPAERTVTRQRNSATPSGTTTRPATLPSNGLERPAEEAAPRRHTPNGSAPLPGSRPASPNTTVLRKAEEWRKAPWAQPLAPLPNLLDSRFIRPVPESLKAIASPDGR